MPYFSEKELSQVARVREDISPGAWFAIVNAIQTRFDDGSFGEEFPDECYQCRGTTGTSGHSMGEAIRREFPFLAWPIWEAPQPALHDALDLLEFCYRAVSFPIPTEQCGYNVRHLEFDRGRGRNEFRAVVNRIFAREGIAFHMDDRGEISRLTPLVLREALASAVFNTGDSELDGLLEDARRKFGSRDPGVRKEAVEKLWDAWERLKSIENPSDKKDSVKRLLDRVATEPRLRELLDTEARALTQAGNDFMIRHAEVGKAPIGTDENVDYLFHRGFAMIRLLLRSTGGGG